jgi:enoyl-CoA hydratase/carnithine racemase
MLRIEDKGSTRWIILDRPGRKNAIPPDGWETLAQAFEDFEMSSQRVLVLAGENDDFCAGADLSPRPMRSAKESHENMLRVNRSALALARCTKPTIAAVDGVAVGAGLNMALLCDVVIATDRARFSEIFVRRGLTVDYGGTWSLPRLVGLQRAKELALSGRIVSAQEALDYGMCLEVMAPRDLWPRATELAEAFANNAPAAQAHIKAAMTASFERSLVESLAHEATAQAECLVSAEAKEGFAAFLEKRPPNFGEL